MARKQIPTEHDEQKAFFDECAWRGNRDADWLCVFAIPNAGKRSFGAARYYAEEGLKSGVPDTLLAVPRCGYHGLFVEFKRAGERLRDSQEVWHVRLRAQGYRVEVCRTAEDAISLASRYLNSELTRCFDV